MEIRSEGVGQREREKGNRKRREGQKEKAKNEGGR